MQEVPWSPVEPYPSSSEEERIARGSYPHFWNADLPQPLRVDVHEGEVLYLPSMWHHHVRQSCGEAEAVIAVNMWYDMSYDCKAAYAKALEELAQVHAHGSQEQFIDHA